MSSSRVGSSRFCRAFVEQYIHTRPAHSRLESSSRSRVDLLLVRTSHLDFRLNPDLVENTLISQCLLVPSLNVLESGCLTLFKTLRLVVLSLDNVRWTAAQEAWPTSGYEPRGGRRSLDSDSVADNPGGAPGTPMSVYSYN